MHPITVIEITFSTIFLIIIFVTALSLPKKFKKSSLVIASSIAVLLLSFFALRPYWVDYQVSKKTEQLHHYLEEKYPNQEWTLSRNIGRNYNPYHSNVVFEDEKGWTYTYSLKETICQSGWSPPKGKFPSEGKHFEMDHCE